MDRDTFSHIRLWCPRPFGTYSQNKARSPGSGGSGGGGGGGGGGGSGGGGGGGSGGGTGTPNLCKAEPSSRSVDGGEDGCIVVGVEDGEAEDAGEENTPPEPECSMSQSQDPLPSSDPPSPPSSGSQMEDGRVLLDTWYVIKPGNTKEKIAFFVAHQFSGAGQPRPSTMKVRDVFLRELTIKRGWMHGMDLLSANRYCWLLMADTGKIMAHFTNLYFKLLKVG